MKCLLPALLSRRIDFAFLIVLISGYGSWMSVRASADEQLTAGVAKVEITDREAGPVNDPLFVKALVVKSPTNSLVLITVDAVAIGEIGRIGNDYLPTVRDQLFTDFGIPPENVMINASHCHGVVRRDVADLTVQAVRSAMESQEQVEIGFGLGFENTISENRRLHLKSGRTIDVRHAYALPPDEEVIGVGPIDPAIGIVKINRKNGSTLSVLYHYACHPIQGVPSGGNTADLTGFASKVIEESLVGDCVALFVQGCGGDINPRNYKQVDQARDAETLGNKLGLSVLREVPRIPCVAESRLKVIHERLVLPRGDQSGKIFELEKRQEQLLNSLRGTTLNLKSFLPLMVKYQLDPEFPSYDSYGYLREVQSEDAAYRKLDRKNRDLIDAYIQNIRTMEELTRVQTNLRLLKKHHASLLASGKRTIEVEVMGIRLGDVKMVTFPGELTVPIGLEIKELANDPATLISGYTNGYIYYAPTTEQLENAGNAQEDSDCILAPDWYPIFRSKALEILRQL